MAVPIYTITHHDITWLGNFCYIIYLIHICNYFLLKKNSLHKTVICYRYIHNITLALTIYQLELCRIEIIFVNSNFSNLFLIWTNTIVIFNFVQITQYSMININTLFCMWYNVVRLSVTWLAKLWRWGVLDPMIMRKLNKAKEQLSPLVQEPKRTRNAFNYPFTQHRCKSLLSSGKHW